MAKKNTASTGKKMKKIITMKADKSLVVDPTKKTKQGTRP